MKKIYLLINLTLLSLISAFQAKACDLSSFDLVSMTDLGGGRYEFVVTFCVGSGQENRVYGGVNNTGTWAVQLNGGATFDSYPTSLTSPLTNAVYGGHTYYGANILAYELQSWSGNGWEYTWACVEGTCGPIASTCKTFTFVTNGLPTSMDLLGAEAGGVGVPGYGCNGYPEMTINVTGPNADAGADQTVCNGGCVTLNGSANAGTPPYTYLWSNGATSASTTVCPSSTTGYTLTVTDFNGATSIDQVTVNASTVVANAGPDQYKYIGYGPNCVTLSGSASGGAAPYSYLWSTNSASSSITSCTNLSGYYTLTVTDNNGCSASDQVNVYVEDVTCGRRGNKVLVCHRGTTKCLSPNKVAQHLNHGDVLGSCGSNKTGEEVIEEEMDYTYSSVYPNPATDRVEIVYGFEDDVDVSIDVYDLSGRKIQSIISNSPVLGLDENRISSSVAEYEAGMYYIIITASNGERLTHKMIVSH